MSKTKLSGPTSFEEMRDALVEKYRHKITVQDGDKITVFYRSENFGLHQEQFAPGQGCMTAICAWIETKEAGE